LVVRQHGNLGRGFIHAIMRSVSKHPKQVRNDEAATGVVSERKSSRMLRTILGKRGSTKLEGAWRREEKKKFHMQKGKKKERKRDIREEVRRMGNDPATEKN